jgi:hypothetical protein
MDFIYNRNFFTESDILQNFLRSRRTTLLNITFCEKNFCYEENPYELGPKKSQKVTFLAHPVYICNKTLYYKLFILYPTTR